MKREEFTNEKFIYPSGDWRCFICRAENESLSEFAETEKEVCLICESCYERNLIMLRADLADL